METVEDEIAPDDEGHAPVRGEAETVPEFVSRWHKKPSAIADPPATPSVPVRPVRPQRRLTHDEIDEY